MKKITYEQIDNACFKLAEKIKSLTPESFVIAAVSRGGLVPAAIVAHYLNYKDIRFIRLSSYTDDTKSQSEITDTTSDVIPNRGNTYIIDDICDSGETVNYLKKKYPQTKIFTLINKNPEIKPDYAPLNEEKGVWVHFPWEVEDR